MKGGRRGIRTRKSRKSRNSGFAPSTTTSSSRRIQLHGYGWRKLTPRLWCEKRGFALRKSVLGVGGIVIGAGGGEGTGWSGTSQLPSSPRLPQSSAASVSFFASYSVGPSTSTQAVVTVNARQERGTPYQVGVQVPEASPYPWLPCFFQSSCSSPFKEPMQRRTRIYDKPMIPSIKRRRGFEL